MIRKKTGCKNEGGKLRNNNCNYKRFKGIALLFIVLGLIIMLSVVVEMGMVRAAETTCTGTGCLANNCKTVNVEPVCKKGTCVVQTVEETKCPAEQETCTCAADDLKNTIAQDALNAGKEYYNNAMRTQIKEPDNSLLMGCDLNAIEKYIAFIKVGTISKLFGNPFDIGKDKLKKVQDIIDKCFGNSGELIKPGECEKQVLFIELKKLSALINQQMAEDATSEEDRDNYFRQAEIIYESIEAYGKNPKCPDRYDCGEIHFLHAVLYKKWSDYFIVFDSVILPSLIDDYNKAWEWKVGNMGVPIFVPDYAKRRELEGKINGAIQRRNDRIMKLSKYFEQLNMASKCSTDPNNPYKKALANAQNKYLKLMDAKIKGNMQQLEDFYLKNFCYEGSWNSTKDAGQMFEFYCRKIFRYEGDCYTTSKIAWVFGSPETDSRTMKNKKIKCLNVLSTALNILRATTTSGISLEELLKNPTLQEERLKKIFDALQSLRLNPEDVRVLPIFKDQSGNLIQLDILDIEKCIRAERILSNSYDPEQLTIYNSEKCVTVRKLQALDSVLSSLLNSNLNGDISRLRGNENKPRERPGFLGNDLKFDKGILEEIRPPNQPYAPFTQEEANMIAAQLRLTPDRVLIQLMFLKGLGHTIGGTAAALSAGELGQAALIIGSFGGTLLAFEGLTVASEEIFGTDLLGQIAGIGGFGCLGKVQGLFIGKRSGKLEGILQTPRGEVDSVLDSYRRQVTSQDARASVSTETVSDLGADGKLIRVDVTDSKGKKHSVFISDMLRPTLENQLLMRGVADIQDRTSLLGKVKDEAACQGKCGETAQPGCFLANTPIKMADGSYKNIQDILKGEKVAAFDITNMKPATAEVTTTFKRPADKYFEVTYEVGD